MIIKSDVELEPPEEEEEEETKETTTQSAQPTSTKTETQQLKQELEKLKKYHRSHPDLPQSDILYEGEEPTPSEEEIKSWEEGAQQSFWWETTSNIPAEEPKEESPYSIMSKKFISRTPESVKLSEPEKPKPKQERKEEPSFEEPSHLTSAPTPEKIEEKGERLSSKIYTYEEYKKVVEKGEELKKRREQIESQLREVEELGKRGEELKKKESELGEKYRELEERRRNIEERAGEVEEMGRRLETWGKEIKEKWYQLQIEISRKGWTEELMEEWKELEEEYEKFLSLRRRYKEERLGLVREYWSWIREAKEYNIQLEEFKTKVSKFKEELLKFDFPDLEKTIKEYNKRVEEFNKKIAEMEKGIILPPGTEKSLSGRLLIEASKLREGGILEKIASFQLEQLGGIAGWLEGWGRLALTPLGKQDIIPTSPDPLSALIGATGIGIIPKPTYTETRILTAYPFYSAAYLTMDVFAEDYIFKALGAGVKGIAKGIGKGIGKITGLELEDMPFLRRLTKKSVGLITDLEVDEKVAIRPFASLEEIGAVGVRKTTLKYIPVERSSLDDIVERLLHHAKRVDITVPSKIELKVNKELVESYDFYTTSAKTLVEDVMEKGKTGTLIPKKTKKGFKLVEEVKEYKLPKEYEIGKPEFTSQVGRYISGDLPPISPEGGVGVPVKGFEFEGEKSVKKVKVKEPKRLLGLFRVGKGKIEIEEVFRSKGLPVDTWGTIEMKVESIHRPEFLVTLTDEGRELLEREMKRLIKYKREVEISKEAEEFLKKGERTVEKKTHEEVLEESLGIKRGRMEVEVVEEMPKLPLQFDLEQLQKSALVEGGEAVGIREAKFLAKRIEEEEEEVKPIEPLAPLVGLGKGLGVDVPRVGRFLEEGLRFSVWNLRRVEGLTRPLIEVRTTTRPLPKMTPKEVAIPVLGEGISLKTGALTLTSTQQVPLPTPSPVPVPAPSPIPINIPSPAPRLRVPRGKKTSKRRRYRAEEERWLSEWFKIPKGGLL